MLPLSQRVRRDPARDLSAHRRSLEIGEAVYPDRPCSRQPSGDQTKKARQRAGSQDDIGPQPPHDPETFGKTASCRPAVIAIGIGNDDNMFKVVPFRQSLVRDGIGDIMALKSIAQEHQLLPMPSPGGDRQYFHQTQYPDIPRPPSGSLAASPWNKSALRAMNIASHERQQAHGPAFIFFKNRSGPPRRRQNAAFVSPFCHCAPHKSRVPTMASILSAPNKSGPL